MSPCRLAGRYLWVLIQLETNSPGKQESHINRYQMLPGNAPRLCQSRSMLTVVKSPPLALCIESCLWYLRFGKTCSDAGRFQLPCVGKSYKNDATFVYIESCFVLFRCLSTSPFDKPEKSGRSSQPLAIPRARLSLPHLHQSLTSLAIGNRQTATRNDMKRQKVTKTPPASSLATALGALAAGVAFQSTFLQ